MAIKELITPVSKTQELLKRSEIPVVQYDTQELFGINEPAAIANPTSLESMRQNFIPDRYHPIWIVKVAKYNDIGELVGAEPRVFDGHTRLHYAATSGDKRLSRINCEDHTGLYDTEGVGYLSPQQFLSLALAQEHKHDLVVDLRVAAYLRYNWDKDLLGPKLASQFSFLAGLMFLADNRTFVRGDSVRLSDGLRNSPLIPNESNNDRSRILKALAKMHQVIKDSHGPLNPTKVYNAALKLLAVKDTSVGGDATSLNTIATLSQSPVLLQKLEATHPKDPISQVKMRSEIAETLMRRVDKTPNTDERITFLKSVSAAINNKHLTPRDVLQVINSRDANQAIKDLEFTRRRADLEYSYIRASFENPPERNQTRKLRRLARQLRPAETRLLDILALDYASTRDIVERIQDANHLDFSAEQAIVAWQEVLEQHEGGADITSQLFEETITTINQEIQSIQDARERMLSTRTAQGLTRLNSMLRSAIKHAEMNVSAALENEKVWNSIYSNINPLVQKLANQENLFPAKRIREEGIEYLLTNVVFSCQNRDTEQQVLRRIRQTQSNMNAHEAAIKWLQKLESLSPNLIIDVLRGHKTLVGAITESSRTRTSSERPTPRSQRVDTSGSKIISKLPETKPPTPTPDSSRPRNIARPRRSPQLEQVRQIKPLEADQEATILANASPLLKVLEKIRDRESIPTPLQTILLQLRAILINSRWLQNYDHQVRQGIQLAELEVRESAVDQAKQTGSRHR